MKYTKYIMILFFVLLTGMGYFEQFPEPKPTPEPTPIPEPTPTVLPLTGFTWENSDSKPGQSYIMLPVTMTGNAISVTVGNESFGDKLLWSNNREIWYGPMFKTTENIRVITRDGVYESIADAPGSAPTPDPINPDSVITSWEKIVDYGDSGYKETGNAWVTYSFGGSNGNSYRYLSHKNSGVKRVGTVTWTVIAPATGKYQIFVTFRATENRTSDADYNVIVNGKKVLSKILNQRGNKEQRKVLLVTVTANKGDKISIILDGTDDNQSDCADAGIFKLVK